MKWSPQNALGFVVVIGLLLPLSSLVFASQAAAEEARRATTHSYFDQAELRAKRDLRVQVGWGSFLRSGAVLEVGYGLRRSPVTLELYGGLGAYGDSSGDESYRAFRMMVGGDVKVGGPLVELLADWGLGVCGAMFGKNWGVDSLGPFEPGLLVGIGGQTIMGNTPLPGSPVVGGYFRLGVALDFRFDSLVVGARLTGGRNLYLGVSDDQVPSAIKEDGSLGLNLVFSL